MIRRIAEFARALTPARIQRFVLKGGKFIGAAHHFPSMENSLRTLHRLGFDPAFCVDVGAYQGEWTRMFRSEFPAVKVLMVEAQSSKSAVLRELAASAPGEITLEIALLGATDGQSVNFSEMETGSSVFAEASQCPRTVTERKTSRLDTLVGGGPYPRVDFLKLDVQGYELEVMKGAPQILKQATAVLLEASLVPINAGCPLLAEVVRFMEAAGFRLFDFCSQIRRQDDVLWQTDLLFIRSDSPLVPRAELT